MGPDDEPEHVKDVLATFAPGLKRRIDAFMAMTPEQQAEQRAKWLAEEEAEKERIRADRRELRLRRVPPEFKDAEITHSAIGDWVEDIIAGREKRGLLLQGQTGVGKTHNLWGIYRRLALEDGPEMMLAKVVTLLKSQRPGAFDEVDFDATLRVPILGLDDIGAEKASEWVEETLFVMFDTRWDWQRPCVITSNGVEDDLTDWVGDRIASRILGSCIVLDLEGRDRRVPA
jgi:DNA replication protein DnaC